MVGIEQNLDFIKTVDWIIDLGPEGGVKGVEIVAAGTPEDVVEPKATESGRRRQLYRALSEADVGKGKLSYLHTADSG